MKSHLISADNTNKTLCNRAWGRNLDVEITQYLPSCQTCLRRSGFKNYYKKQDRGVFKMTIAQRKAWHNNIREQLGKELIE